MTNILRGKLPVFLSPSHSLLRFPRGQYSDSFPAQFFLFGTPATVTQPVSPGNQHSASPLRSSLSDDPPPSQASVLWGLPPTLGLTAQLRPLGAHLPPRLGLTGLVLKQRAETWPFPKACSDTGLQRQGFYLVGLELLPRVS